MLDIVKNALVAVLVVVLGKTSGRGHKGQNARSGGGVRPAFEGGQTPLFKRIPKRGFTNINRVEYDVVNVEALNCFDAGAKVTPEKLEESWSY